MCQVYPFFEQISEGNHSYLKIVGSRTLIHTQEHYHNEDECPQIILRNEIDASTETTGAFTSQSIQKFTHDLNRVSRDDHMIQFICATVVLRDDLLRLRGTVFDHFSAPGAIDPMCLFDM